MESLEALFLDALKSLEGADRFVPGASFGAQAHKMARVAGRNLRDELKASHRTMLEALAASPQFEVVERPNTDFLVRIRTDMPSSEEGPIIGARVAPSQRLRDDIYAAFTRTGKQFVYDKRTDSFYPADPEQISGDIVAMPVVTLEQLVTDRQLFTETLTEPVRESAVAVLTSERPLTGFKNFLIAHHAFDQWISFHNQLLVPRLREWASANGVAVSEAWFQSATMKPDNVFRLAVQRIIMAMPDDELGQISIPLKYIRLLLPR